MAKNIFPLKLYSKFSLFYLPFFFTLYARYQNLYWPFGQFTIKRIIRSWYQELEEERQPHDDWNYRQKMYNSFEINWVTNNVAW